MWGNKTKKLRKELGLTQTECAGITGHSQSSISGYEKSENSDLDYISKLCKHAGIPLWQFFMPDNGVIPTGNDEYEKLYAIYVKFPKQLQKLVMHCVSGIDEAYKHGKESTSPKKKKPVL